MKSIKFFKYWYSYEFEKCLKDYGYTIDDVEGFNVSFKCWFKGNFLKTYIVYLSDNEYLCFKVVDFKSFNECNKVRLGFEGETLLGWYKDAHIRRYKLNNEYIYD